MTLTTGGARTTDEAVRTPTGSYVHESDTVGFGWSLADEDYDPRPLPTAAYTGACLGCPGPVCTRCTQTQQRAARRA
jgi:hypothetical protein